MRREGIVAAVIMAMGLALGVGCQRSTAQAQTGSTGAAGPAEVTAGANGRVAVRVDGEGYHPATIHAAPGQQVTLVFTRTTDETCGQRVLIPTLHREVDLPLNHPVEVALVAPASGNVAFTCGMHMFQGSVVAR